MGTSPATLKTTCPYCGVGCGIEITRDADGMLKVRGDRDHPANLGRLCSKGLALGETLDLFALDRHGALVFFDTVAIEHPDLDDRTGDTRRQRVRSGTTSSSSAN